MRPFTHTLHKSQESPHAVLRAAPVRQQVWGRLAVGNFFLGGMGASAYLLAVLFLALAGASFSRAYAVLRLLAPALVLCGFLCVALEAGQPFRGWRVLGNLRCSWMSRELLVGLTFVLLALGDTFWPYGLLKILAGIVAAAFIVSQGLILFHARSIPAWNQRRVPVIFVSSGLLTGAALLLGLTTLLQREPRAAWLLGGIVWGLTLVDLGLWGAYLRQTPTTAALQQALEALRSAPLLASIVGIGHLLPLFLLGGGLLLPLAWPILPLAASAALVLGGMCLKDGLVTQAGYVIGLPIPRLASSARLS